MGMMTLRTRVLRTVRRRRMKKIRHITPRSLSLIPSLLRRLDPSRVSDRVVDGDVEGVEGAGGRKRGRRMWLRLVNLVVSVCWVRELMSEDMDDEEVEAVEGEEVGLVADHPDLLSWGTCMYHPKVYLCQAVVLLSPFSIDKQLNSSCHLSLSGNFTRV